ncbi:MAG: hypothetical protein KGJ44_12985, partial [Betaproteobacteria bacterium]|nr:hypothetical protein [Betaproteobacteria bacterium]
AARADFSHPLLTRDKTDFSRWRGQLYVSLERAQLARVRRYADLPLALLSGMGSVRAWLDIDRKAVQQVTADIALLDVRAQLSRKTPELELQRLSGRLVAQLGTPGIAVQARQLTWQRQGRAAQPPADLAFSYLYPDDAKRASGSLQASTLDLGELRELAGYLVLPAALKRALDAHQPLGRLTGLSASWKGMIDQPSAYQLRTRFDQLAVTAVPYVDVATHDAAAPAAATATPPHPHPGIPGATGLSGTIDANQQQGQADLVVDHGTMTFPGVFEQPTIDLDRFAARLRWVKRDTWVVTADNVEFANAYAAGSAQAQWRPVAQRADGKASPGYLDLSGQLTRADLTQVSRYLPLGVAQPVREYFQHALAAGKSSDVQFAVKGDLYDFPYGNGSGDFRIAAKIDDATLNYVTDAAGKPVWPPFSAIQGQLVFDRTSMQLKDAQARVFGVSLSKVNGGIANMEHDAALQLSGQAQGPLDDFLRYVQQSPVDRWTGQALASARGTGAAKLDLQLKLPLAALAQSSVDGALTLAGGNDLRLNAFTPGFTRANGTVKFNEKGFSIAAMKAQFIGGDMQLGGGTRPDGTTLLNASGTFTADALRREP